mgnify:CR=1 FL=1|jgi:aminodeoxyfutalosine deaminase
MSGTSGELAHNRRMILAAGVIDATGMAACPGAVLVEGDRILAAGSPEQIGSVPEAELVQMPEMLLLPGLVNAHAHLDLSGEGVWPAAGNDFRGWVGQVRGLRAAQTPAMCEQAVQRGIELALAGGTSCIGDIAGHSPMATAKALRESSLRGVSFQEVFGLGDRQEATVDRMRAMVEGAPLEAQGIRLGLSPHAPYSCGPAVFGAAAECGLPLTTHLAETQAEIELSVSGTGSLRDMLERDIGVWDTSVDVPRAHPIDALIGSLDRGQFLCAHLNWIESRHVDMLAASDVRVVYCPRASAAFGHCPPMLPSHPWRRLHDAGVTVCLGTDSLLCLDTPDRLSVLDDMRLLFQRDGVDARLLLSMATTHGASALDLEHDLVRFGPGLAGVLACRAEGNTIDTLLADVLGRDDAPQWAVGGGAA